MGNLTRLEQFNQLGDVRKSLIRKALDSSVGTGEALIPEKLEQVITNAVVRLAPEMALIQPEYDSQKFHEYNQLTNLPGAGGAMGEAATTPTRNSNYARKSVEMKVIRRKGSVTNFLQDSSERYIDSAAAEMENHLLAHVYDNIVYIMYGNAEADEYTYSGIDFYARTNRINESEGGTVIADLTTLDEMIDRNHELQGQGHNKVFVMSPRMLSKVSSMLTNVRLNQGLLGSGLTQVDVGGGWRLNAYRDIPIIESGATKPKTKLGTVTLASSGSGAAIADDEYFFRVAAVTWDGEQEASDEVSISTTSADTITASWAAVANALYYKVYEGLSSGSTKLIRVISAFTYDGSGTVTGDNTSIAFTADPAADDSVPTELQSDSPLVATGGVTPEYMALWDLDKYQGMGKFPYTNRGGARFGGLVTIEDLARTDDFLPFLIKTYGSLCPSFEETTVIHRGLRTA